MRFLTATIIIILLSAAAEWFLPWWMIAVVCFVVALFAAMRPGKSFLMGFAGIAVFWTIAALMRDVPNDHILSGRMAALFHLPNYGLFIVVTAAIGGLAGGLAAWAGGMMGRR